MFWKSTPKKDWPTDAESLNAIQQHWVEPFGDMRQELVFIGQQLDQTAMIHKLNECLLSDDELLKGETYWTTLSDPFPSWSEDT